MCTNKYFSKLVVFFSIEKFFKEIQMAERAARELGFSMLNAFIKIICCIFVDASLNRAVCCYSIAAINESVEKFAQL